MSSLIGLDGAGWRVRVRVRVQAGFWRGLEAEMAARGPSTTGPAMQVTPTRPDFYVLGSCLAAGPIPGCVSAPPLSSSLYPALSSILSLPLPLFFSPHNKFAPSPISHPPSPPLPARQILGALEAVLRYWQARLAHTAPARPSPGGPPDLAGLPDGRALLPPGPAPGPAGVGGAGAAMTLLLVEFAARAVDEVRAGAAVLGVARAPRVREGGVARAANDPGESPAGPARCGRE